MPAALVNALHPRTMPGWFGMRMATLLLDTCPYGCCRCAAIAVRQGSFDTQLQQNLQATAKLEGTGALYTAVAWPAASG